MSRFLLNSTKEGSRRGFTGWLENIVVYIVLFVLCLVAAILVFLTNGGVPANGGLQEKEIQVISAFLAGSIMAALCVLWRLKRLNQKTLLFLLFLLGVLMRLAYAAAYPVEARQHDVFDTDGHLQYILRLAETWQLPDSNNWQYNHPPLHHFLAAVWIRVFQWFGVTDQMQLGETLQFLTCFYSCAMLVVVYRIFDENHFGRRAVPLAYALVCLHPTFYLLAGSLNNDCLMVLLFFAAVLYTLRWYRDPSLKNSLMLAVSIGCCMMTKVSGGIIAPVTGMMFLWKLVVLGKERKWKLLREILAKLAAFGAVCVPLGLWYPIRNLILFGQPLGYVAPIGEDAAIYCGNEALADRFVPLLSSDWTKSLYCDPFEDYNIFAYVTKCSVFGETSLSGSGMAAAILLVCAFLLIVGALVSMVYVLIRGRNERTSLFFWVMAAVMITQVGLFLYSNVKYPYGCTMDFRYLAPTVLPGAVFLGAAGQRLWRSKKESHQYLAAVLYCVAFLFCVSGVFLYLTLS